MDTPEVQRAQDKTDGVIVVLDDLEQIDIKSLGILGIVAHEKQMNDETELVIFGIPLLADIEEGLHPFHRVFLVIVKIE